MNIAIIGCGYLGSEVARIWFKKGYSITATTRRSERLTELSSFAQKGLILKGNDEDALSLIIQKNDVILVTIAADSPDNYEEAYLSTALSFRHLALKLNQPKHLIYSSSTSVYGDHHGLWVDEASELKAANGHAEILINTENAYLSLKDFGWTVTLFRFSELYGPKRELSKKAKNQVGHTLPGTGDQYSNMIHIHDAAHAIEYGLRHKLEGIFNVSDDEHPTRKELYDKICERFNVPLMKWEPSLTSVHRGNKRVSNHKIKAEGFTFLHPHRVYD